MAKRKNTRSTKKANELPKVHKELEGFDIRINSFGEITSTFDMDKINEFLNRNVEDKKLKDRDDLPGVKKSEEPEEEELSLDNLDVEEEEE